MSLQSILQGYSQDMNQRSRIEEEHIDDVKARQANTYNEKIQNVKEHFDSAAQGLSTASAAYHLGRKVYKNIQAKRAQASQPKDTPDGTETSSGQGTSDAPTIQDNFEYINKGKPVEGTSGEEGVPQFKPDAPSAGAGASGEAEQAQATASRIQAVQLDTPSTIGSKEGMMPDKEPSGDLSRNLGSSEHEASAGEASTQQGAKEGVDSITNTTGESGSKALGDVGETTGNQLNSFSHEMGSQVESQVKKAGSSALENAGKTALSDAGEQLGKSAIGEIASNALDFIPVIGELGALGSGIAALVEGFKHKPKSSEDESTPAVGQAQTGLDPTALTSGTRTGGTTVV